MMPTGWEFQPKITFAITKLPPKYWTRFRKFPFFFYESSIVWHLGLGGQYRELQRKGWVHEGFQTHSNRSLYNNFCTKVLSTQHQLLRDQYLDKGVRTDLSRKPRLSVKYFEFYIMIRYPGEMQYIWSNSIETSSHFFNEV